MRIKKIIALFITVLATQAYSCTSVDPSNDTSVSTDPKAISRGEILFTQKCSGCHNFRQDGIGPQLSNLTSHLSADWIKQFVKAPEKIIASGDQHANELFAKYKIAMPSFAYLSNDEVDEIIAYINSKKEKVTSKSVKNNQGLKNPVKDSITLSGLTVNPELFTQMPPSIESGKLPYARITKLDYETTSRNIYILDLRGKLYKINNCKPALYMDLAKLKPKFIHEPGLGTGFGSFAFHPNFSKNGLLYTTHTESVGTAIADFKYADSIKVSLQWVLTEWQTKNPNAPIFSGTGRELMRINMVHVVHGIQEIRFNPLATLGSSDYGKLYICVGDGGSVDEGFPFITGSNEKVWGTILRIDPTGRNSANNKYGIPGDNPFAKTTNDKIVKEIFAFGFRNPHRITWTSTGDLIASSIGGENVESMDIIKPGNNYGWPIREGSFVLNPYNDINNVYPLPVNDSIYHITYPIAQYDHRQGTTAISGGFEYTGTKLPALKGKFIFGDIPSGRLFYIETKEMKQGNQAHIKEFYISLNGHKKTLKQLCGNDRVDLHFGKDAEGELYLLTKTDGKVYTLKSATLK